MANKMIEKITIVCGVDARTLDQLGHTIDTWMRHKPSLAGAKMLLFYDRDALQWQDVHTRLRTVDPKLNITYVKWPYTAGAVYEKTSDDKWGNPQRHKMLAGYVHVPALYVQTPYWLKIDTDVLATGNDDWIDPTWFDDCPAIVAPPWHYTKPADQMTKLDAWAEKGFDGIAFTVPPLNLKPEPGASTVRHKRICSWVAFFNTEFTRQASHAAMVSIGGGKLPVPSQDGYLWYFAHRRGLGIVPVAMKNLGWSLASHRTLPQAAASVLQ